MGVEDEARDFAAVAAVLLGGASAKANFIAIYTGNVGSTYNYTLRFTLDQAGETLRSGDTVTLYDVPIPAAPPDIVNVAPPSSPAGMFTVSQQPVGITPADLVGAAGIQDSAVLQNITFTYTGPDRSTPQDFANAVIVMLPMYTGVRVGKESGSTEIDFFLSNDNIFHQDTSVRSVLLPNLFGTVITPEPGSLVVMGLGAVALVVRRRRAGKAVWSTLM